jgi:hypothetical protein
LINPALGDVSFLVGEWEMTISNASFLPDRAQVVSGHMEVTPIEAGMLLALRQASDSAGPPMASWVIGRDGSRPGYTVLYTDGRGVSRIYEMRLSEERWTIWRDDPEFSQRFEALISADHHFVDGRWEKRPAAGEWEHDFNVMYSRQ